MESLRPRESYRLSRIVQQIPRRSFKYPTGIGPWQESQEAHESFVSFVFPISHGLFPREGVGGPLSSLTRFAIDSSCGTRFASIHRVFSFFGKQIKTDRASVDAWSPPQAVCHQTWSPLQARCHHHDTACLKFCPS